MAPLDRLKPFVMSVPSTKRTMAPATGSPAEETFPRTSMNIASTTAESQLEKVIIEVNKRRSKEFFIVVSFKQVSSFEFDTFGRIIECSLNHI